MTSAGALGVLRAAAKAERNGELVCAAGDVEIHVFLQRGRVAWATDSAHPFEFARCVRKRCKIDAETFREVVETCRRDRLPLGETLIAWHLATAEDVTAALLHQVTTALDLIEEADEGMFFERPKFSEYDARFTFELDAILRPLLPTPSMRGAMLSAPLSERVPDAAQLAEAIKGSAWVELRDRRGVADAATAAGATPRVPPAFARVVLDADVDIAAVRSPSGTLIASRFRDMMRELWVALASDSSFGPALATLLGLDALAARSRSDNCVWNGVSEAKWRVGATSESRAFDLEQVLSSGKGVLAAMVLDAEGDPVFGVGGSGIDSGTCEVLLRKRARIFASRDEFVTMTRPTAMDAEASAIGYRYRTLVTGEPRIWCFGAEVLTAEGGTLWVLTNRSAPQGLGWACLTTLARNLTRAAGAPAESAA